MLYRYKQFRTEKKRLNAKGVMKYFLRWNNAMKPGASSIKDEQPWITFESIDFLDRLLNKTHKVFEYGGGGSTLFFVKRAGEVVTVEHDKDWFATLESKINSTGIKNWKGNLIEKESGNLLAHPDFANPNHYTSDDEASKNFNYKKYVTAIDEYSDFYFDVVLVDGRSRPACIQHAIPKIKLDGYLVVDNSDREYYFSQTQTLIDQYFVCVFNRFSPVPYLTHFTKTSVWKKVK